MQTGKPLDLKDVLHRCYYSET